MLQSSPMPHVLAHRHLRPILAAVASAHTQAIPSDGGASCVGCSVNTTKVVAGSAGIGLRKPCSYRTDSARGQAEKTLGVISCLVDRCNQSSILLASRCGDNIRDRLNCVSNQCTGSVR